MSGFFRLEVIEKPFNPRTVRTNQDAGFTIQPFGTGQGTQRVVQRCFFLMKKDVLAVPAFNKLSSHRERLRLCCAFVVETNALAASFTRAVIFMGMDFLGKPSDHR